MTDHVESELKLPVADLAPVRDRLAAAGGECLRPAAREHNVLFDTAERRLADRHCALRLRRWGEQAWLTFKGPPTVADGVKSRHEIETRVADPDAAEALLRALGYRPVVRYEKDRESWRLGTVRVELDHTPVGDFVELEGPVAELAPAATRLGLEPARSLGSSYLALWQRHRAEHPELDLGPDMVWP